ncbi:peptidase family C50-domain-containing protein [Peziza echinospora]|nr:peptidase family C50-domain-containing protein [Peziza echinospora]
MATTSSRPTQQVQSKLSITLSPIDSVKQAVGFPETCTSTTASLLNDLLFPAVNPPAAKPSSRPTARITAAKKKPTAPAAAALTTLERYRLATEVVNSTLRTLNNVSKQSQAEGQVAAAAKVSSAKAQKTAKTTSQPLPSRSGTGPAGAQQHPAVWVAECCRLAIGYIYTVQHSKEELPAPPPKLQIETAQHNLIIRLIILKLYNLASKELKVLKKRLDAFIEGSSEGGDAEGPDKKKATVNRTKAGENDDADLASLLIFKNMIQTVAVMDLVVAFQLSVLRCVIGMNKPNIIEALIPALTAPYNPLVLMKALPNSAQKLATLDSLISNCCPSASSSADKLAKNPASSPNPTAVLHLQAYAFEAKLAAGSKKPEETWDYLSRFLAAFCRRCTPKDGGKDRYKAVREVVSRYQKILTGKDVPENILQILATVAQEAGLANEALKWLEKANSTLENPGSQNVKNLNDAAKAGRLVRLATLCLKAYSTSSQPTSGASSIITSEDIRDTISKVQSAVESVDAVSKVKMDDLERLSQEVALFRRAAAIIASTSTPPAANETPELLILRTNLREACMGISEVAVRFFRKYLSIHPKDEERIKRFATPAIDFVASIVRQEVVTMGEKLKENWDTVDAKLYGCYDLLKLLSAEPEEQDDSKSEEEEVEETKESGFEKIAAAYWKAACALKKIEAQRESIVAMKRCVTVLTGRPKEEQTRAGLFPKVERLGNAFFQAGEYTRAEEMYLEALAMLRDQGVMEEILEFADNTSLSDIFGEDKLGNALGRILDGIVKCAVKDVKRRGRKGGVEDAVPFDDETLNRETRGLILEWQLRGLCGLGTKDTTVIGAVTDRLIETYADEEPLRRARVISKILKLQVDNPMFMDRSLVLELGEEVEALAPLHRDASLRQYRDDIVSSCLVSHAFLHYQAEEPRPDLLKTALLSWQDIVDRCHDWDELVHRIEIPEELISQLYMLIDFFEMKGLSFHRITALRTLVLMKGLELEIDFNSLVKLQSQLGTQYLRMGYSGKAGMALAKAMNWTEKEGVVDETKVQWHLAYTEYLVGIGNTQKAGEHYSAATQIVGDDTSIFEKRKNGSKLERRVALNRMIADASYVMSLLSFEAGNSIDSLSHVRRCIRLNQRSWANLEQLCKDTATSTTKDLYPQVVPHANPEVQKVIDGVGKLSIKSSTISGPPVQSTTFAALNAPLLWTLVTSMYLSLIQASFIYRHQGMVREAMYNMEQALKTVEAVGATPLIAQALSIFGDLKIRSGAMEEGADMLERATDLRREIDKSKEIVTLDCSLGYLHGKQMLWENELEAYEHAEAKLEAIMSPTFIRNIDALQAVEDEDGDSRMEEPEEVQPPPKKARTPRKAPAGGARPRANTASAKAAEAAAAALVAAAKANKSIITECSSLLKMRGNILRLKAYNLAIQNQCEQAEALLLEAGKLPSGHHELIYQRLSGAKHLLIEGLALLASDPVFCVLQDSTISLPSVAVKAAVAQSPPGSPKKRKDAKDAEADFSKADQFVEKLTKARDSVAEIHTLAAKVGSTTMVHSVSMLLSGIIVLLSAVTSSKGKSMSNPLFASYSLELNKGLPLIREKDAIAAERSTSTNIDTLSWPGITLPIEDSVSSVSLPFSFSTFQRDFIDIIPHGWAAVSISLSEAHDELYISRFQAGQGQFMLRLPLTRHNSRDEAEEVFEYKTGMDSLREIMEQANLSTHSAKDATGGSKATKAEWWAERESLDLRFGELLANIEGCWLGGFKGIFGQYPRHQELLKRFRIAFDKILAKHLPSRQPRRGGKRGKMASSAPPGDHVKIDVRVLDLFVGVGNPNATTVGANGEDVEDNIEAPLLDLLWFVFDILQFHGEKNAYDEVDVDAMIVDITEAIRQYHQQLTYQPKSECEDTQHTILILDKSLHAIPWESLPCLDGHAISRLPSMASLREILLSKQIDLDQTKPGIYVDENKGTWILNPSGDLKSTQTAFEKDLSNLPSTWTGISSRQPTETEFSDSLSTSEILLYFGHGSGGQYIRARTVKKLDSCAVALLMGCSSGTLKEAGEFQPYGMPLAYLLGGSAAVVANLWDVTDKDIDRFSRKALEEWGLFRHHSNEQGGKGKGSSRSKSRDGAGLEDRGGGAGGVGGTTLGSGKGKVSLVEAVARGRKECHLKYLNGAAPVVYGVPVYLA